MVKGGSLPENAAANHDDDNINDTEVDVPMAKAMSYLSKGSSSPSTVNSTEADSDGNDDLGCSDVAIATPVLLSDRAYADMAITKNNRQRGLDIV